MSLEGIVVGLLAVIIGVYFYTKGRSRRMDEVTDRETRNLRERLNREDTGGPAQS